MESRSQAIYAVRRFLREALPIAVLVLIFGAAVGVAWVLITRPPAVHAAKRPVAPPEAGFFSVAGAAVDLEVFGPDGRHTSTVASADTSMKIALSDGHVECDNYGDPHATEANCTASVVVRQPAYGEYRVVATSADKRGETLNVGWGGLGFRRSGGFDVRVVVDPKQSATFTVRLAEEGAQLRSQPQFP